MVSDEIMKGYEQAFKELGKIGEKQYMDSIDEMLEEWHETKSISVANDICGRLWQAGHEEEE